MDVLSLICQTKPDIVIRIFGGKRYRSNDCRRLASEGNLALLSHSATEGRRNVRKTALGVDTDVGLCRLTEFSGRQICKTDDIGLNGTELKEKEYPTTEQCHCPINSVIDSQTESSEICHNRWMPNSVTDNENIPTAHSNTKAEINRECKSTKAVKRGSGLSNETCINADTKMQKDEEAYSNSIKPDLHIAMNSECYEDLESKKIMDAITIKDEAPSSLSKLPTGIKVTEKSLAPIGTKMDECKKDHGTITSPPKCEKNSEKTQDAILGSAHKNSVTETGFLYTEPNGYSNSMPNVSDHFITETNLKEVEVREKCQTESNVIASNDKHIGNSKLPRNNSSIEDIKSVGISDQRSKIKATDDANAMKQSIGFHGNTKENEDVGEGKKCNMDEENNNLTETIPLCIYKLSDCIKICEHEPVMLNCKFTGHPQPRVRWLREGNEIRNDGEYILDESDDGNYLLIISQPTVHHSGNYVCIAENTVGSAQTICSLTVSKQATFSTPDMEEQKECRRAEENCDTPAFESTPEDVYVLQGESATLTCKVLNKHLPLITWLRDHDVIANGGRFQTYTTVDGTCCLQIDDVDYDDIGEYKCLAVNSGGVKQITAYLEIAETPMINQALATQYTLEGQKVQLDCEIEGIPEPHISWYKDGVLITKSDRHRQSVTKYDVYSLSIYHFEPSDVGEYSIHASNMAGRTSCSALVQLKDGNNVIIKKNEDLEDHYNVLEELGRGAFGITKRCISFDGNKTYAAKIIRIRNGNKDDIYREIDIMSCLDHQRLIKLYDAYETRGEITMDFNEGLRVFKNMEDLESVTGGELFERIIDQESFTEDRAAFFIRQVLEGLQYMHKKGVVHLDLKPENILLESGNRDDIKLIDFGLAQKLLPGKNITCKKGTPEFVAPELVKQQPVTKESDVWSVGVIAYILLSGLSPFLGDTDRDTLLKVKSSEWDFDDEVWDTISDDAKEFISKLLKEEPSDRLATEKCLQHKWLKVEELKYAEKERARLSTIRLKTFNSRRKWQRALTAVKSAIRICRLSSLTSIKNGSGKSANTTVTCTEEPILEGGTISKSINQTAKTATEDEDVPNKSTTNQENLKTGKVAGVIRDMERRISETDRGDFTNNTKGIDEYSNVACLENDCSDGIQTDNRLESSNLQTINKDIPSGDLNACNCNVEKTNKESTLGEDTNCVHVKNEILENESCVSHVDHVAIEDTQFVLHGNSTESNNVENCNTQHKEEISQIPLTINAEPNTVVINASNDIGRTLSLKLESSHMVSGLTIESPAVISSVSSDTFASNCDAVTTLVGFFSENSSDSITEALPKAAADLQYGLLNQEKEPTLSYIDRNGNTGRRNGEGNSVDNQTSKSNGESSAFASQTSKSNGESSAFASQTSKSNGESSAFASQTSKSNGESSAFASQTSKSNGERNVLASYRHKSSEEISTIASSNSSDKSTALASQRSKSNGDINAFVDQGNTNMRRRRLIKSLTIDQPNLDKQTSCATRRRIYSANDEIEPNSQESLDSVFTDTLDDATTSRSSSSSDSTSRQLPSTRRTSKLFSISENEDSKKKENPSEANSPPSTTNKLIKRRSTYQKWSQESQDSIDVPINKKSEEFFSQMNTDIMAADADRQSKSKKRRTGFAFQPGQDSIPANAFLNTSEEESPKMLSVAAVMMKLHMNRQTSRTPTTTDETDKTKSTERPSSKKITLTGQQRELSPQDIENNLDFLTISDDENLNFPTIYKMWQLQNNKYVNMVVGGLFGLFLGLLFRFIISIITDIIL